MEQVMKLHPDVLKAYESVPDLYLILSPELYIITASDAYLKASFKTRKGIQGRYVFDVFPDNPETPDADGVRNVKASLDQVLKTAQPHQMALQRYDVLRATTEDGGFEEKIWNPVNTPVLDEEGHVSYIIHKVSDVTKILKAERQVKNLKEEAAILVSELAESNKELTTVTALLQESNVALAQKNQRLLKINNDLDNFTYAISHDLKGSMASLQSIIVLLNQSLIKYLPEKERNLIGVLSKVTDKLNNNLDNLLKLAEIQKNPASDIEFTPVLPLVSEIKNDIDDLIVRYQAIFQEQYEVSKIPFPKPGLRSIHYNLISNALKYHSPSRSLLIQVRTYRKKNQVVLEVEDNGRGMNKQQREKLFTHFLRFHPDVEGNGVGLFMIKRMIENNGGSIEVGSQEDQGTKFSVFFPVS